MRLALIFLLFVLPLVGARNYQQTDTAAAQCSSTEAVACSSHTAADADAVGREAGGTAGTTEITVTLGTADDNVVCGWYESDDVNDTSWAAGDWVVRINVTTNAEQTWDRTDVCRVSSDCSTVHATVGSDTTTQDLNTTGTKTMTVSGAAQGSANATDLWLVVLGCDSDQAHGNSTVGVTPDELIDTPLDAPVPPAPSPLIIKTTRVLSNAVTGTQDITITGVGTPVAAIIEASEADTDATAKAPARTSTGVTDGTRVRTQAAMIADNTAAMTPRKALSSADIVLLTDTSGTAVWAASFTTWITDGIRITLGTVPGGGVQIFLTVTLIAGGGTDAYAGNFSLSATQNGTTAITDPGFTPHQIFAIGQYQNGADMSYSRGIADNGGSIVQRAACMFQNDTDADAEPNSQIDDRYFYIRVSKSTDVSTGEVTSFDANGFTVTQRSATPVGDPVAYLALRYVSAAHWVGTIDTPTSAGDQAITGPGFKPQFVGLGMTHMTAMQTKANDGTAGTLGLGFAHSPTAEFSNSIQHEGVLVSY